MTNDEGVKLLSITHISYFNKISPILPLTELARKIIIRTRSNSYFGYVVEDWTESQPNFDAQLADFAKKKLSIESLNSILIEEAYRLDMV
jgi:hypothetical protein